MASCDMTDDAGMSVHLKDPAKRIISLAPDLTETLFAIGVGARIVGVVDRSDYPPRARTIARIGSSSGIDLERIISLHPDLIVTWNHIFSRELTVLRAFRVPIYTADPHQLEDIPRTMKNLGCLTGQDRQAKIEADLFLDGLAKLRQHYETKRRLSVFYQIGPNVLITVNKNSWINQVIMLCGGYNVFANATFSAPEISLESLVIANPQVIISDTVGDAWQRHFLAWQEIAAVSHHLLFSINPDLIERASPRLLLGASTLCRDLQVAKQAYR